MLPKEEAEKKLRSMLGIKEQKPHEEKKQEPKKPAAKLSPKEEPKPTEKETVEKNLEQEKETQQKLERKSEERPTQKGETTQLKSEFYGEVNNYFIRNRIKVVEETIIRKNSEIEFIVEVPSAVGGLRYYVKAKSKKRINDGDLSSIFIQGQTKRLPVLFLSKGELTKKAQEMLETEFKGMRFNKI